MNENVRQLVNDPKRIGVLATNDRQGNPNVAVFGSPHMPDDLTLVMGLGDTRTAQNLLETGRAAFLSVLPGETGIDSKGTRIYLKVRAMEKEGPNLEAIREKIRQRGGDRAAARIQYAVFFDIEASRPLIDWTPNK
ncbi:MAG: pyridoxamine 5'-phosphate oxidase family protein [Deltaproteobacteria bacterium]|nr:pyridoxamine 5'-phosphate oxidase family protein [Deltaproteobacteria bacterium]